ncbi:transposase [Micromonospora sp. DT15]|uniref:transposase n=1 Tax=Micromonospora sp. DT15 TaxID=3393445 RepID=UPI003CF3567D
MLKPLDDRDVGKHRTDIPLTPNRGHFASWNGTAPLDASSGDQKRHRLSRAGNRRTNRVLHIMAIVQMRHDTEGRAYYRRKLAAGKTPMEAIPCLKRRLSDAIYKQMIKDAVCEDGPGRTRGDDSSIQRGRPNPHGRHFGTVTSRTRNNCLEHHYSPPLDTEGCQMSAPASGAIRSARTRGGGIP